MHEIPSTAVAVDHYLQAGSPSPTADTTGLVVFTPMPQLKFEICECVTVAVQ